MMLSLLRWFYSLTGVWGVAIIMLTIVIKGLLLPLTIKQYSSMRKMKELQPEMEKIREKYGDDKVKQQQEMQALFQRTGVNPLAGCMPMVLQFPVWIALYAMLGAVVDLTLRPGQRRAAGAAGVRLPGVEVLWVDLGIDLGVVALAGAILAGLTFSAVPARATAAVVATDHVVAARRAGPARSRAVAARDVADGRRGGVDLGTHRVRRSDRSACAPARDRSRPSTPDSRGRDHGRRLPRAL